MIWHSVSRFCFHAFYSFFTLSRTLEIELRAQNFLENPLIDINHGRLWLLAWSAVDGMEWVCDQLC
jgi:hypothetical protein